jgi:hypothetical protein
MLDLAHEDSTPLYMYNIPWMVVQLRLGTQDTIAEFQLRPHHLYFAR